MELKRNTLLNKKYIIEKVLSRDGGFSIVYTAKIKGTKKKVVIKEFVPDQGVTREGKDIVAENEFWFKGIKDVFKVEGDFLREFEHKHLVKHIDDFEENNTHYIVMELIEGDTLKEYVKKKKKLTPSEAMDIFGKMLEAIEYLHEREILHRDIKPDNILIINRDNKEEEDIDVKVIDFGSACRISEKDDDFVKVTKGYSPLEMYAMESKHHFGTDIYSAFATLYYMLEGKKPLEAPKRIFNSKLIFETDIDKDLQLLIGKNMNLDLRDRDARIEWIVEKLVVEGLCVREEEVKVEEWEEL